MHFKAYQDVFMRFREFQEVSRDFMGFYTHRELNMGFKSVPEAFQGVLRYFRGVLGGFRGSQISFTVGFRCVSKRFIGF